MSAIYPAVVYRTPAVYSCTGWRWSVPLASESLMKQVLLIIGITLETESPPNPTAVMFAFQVPPP